MRRGNGGGVRRTEDGRIESVNMGADYTSEHEWGIKELERDFGLDMTLAPGVPRRTISRVPVGVIVDTKKHIIGYPGRWQGQRGEPLGVHSLDEIGFYGDEDETQGAWSDGDFAVQFRNTPQAETDLLDLSLAFHNLDIAFLFQNVGNNPFARAGLNLVIVSRLPKEIVDDLAEKDADHDKLTAAALATGIRSRLDAFSKRGTRDYSPRCGYYALSPRWANEEKTEVVFWLNPEEQSRNNSGLFTVDDLDAWMNGEGPVVKVAP